MKYKNHQRKLFSLSISCIINLIDITSIECKAQQPLHHNMSRCTYQVVYVYTISRPFVQITMIMYVGRSPRDYSWFIGPWFSKMHFSILFFWLVLLDLPLIMPSHEYHRTLRTIVNIASANGLVPSGPTGHNPRCYLSQSWPRSMSLYGVTGRIIFLK